MEFLLSDDVIIGYKTSEIARSEYNDCVIKAFAVALGIHYDAAHKIVTQTFNRRLGRGTQSFSIVMNDLAKGGKRINGKRVSCVVHPDSVVHPDNTSNNNSLGLLYWVHTRGKNSIRKMTTGTFARTFPFGTYIVHARGHAFVIANGCVIGNPEDGTQRKRTVYNAWKIY